jgi:hypothetical protein
MFISGHVYKTTRLVNANTLALNDESDDGRNISNDNSSERRYGDEEDDDSQIQRWVDLKN